MSLQQSYSGKAYSENLIKTFLDQIVLSMLNGTPKHGYRIIAELHKNFRVLLSPGTLYPLLYKLEEDNLLQVKVSGRKKLYSLTPKGRKDILHINKLYKRHSKRVYDFVDINLELAQQV